MEFSDQNQDRHLAARAAAGDEEALAVLYMRHQRSLRGQVLRHIGDPDQAADIVQDAFIDLLRGLHTYDPARPFLPWMRRVCRNRMLKHLRERRSEWGTDVIERIAADDGEADEPLFGDESQRALRDCLAALPSEHRQLLARHYRYGEPMADLAREMGVQANAVMVRFHRLRKRLRACLEGKGITA